MIPKPSGKDLGAAVPLCGGYLVLTPARESGLRRAIHKQDIRPCFGGTVGSGGHGETFFYHAVIPPAIPTDGTLVANDSSVTLPETAFELTRSREGRYACGSEAAAWSSSCSGRMTCSAQFSQFA